jgi:TetR/AcrR family transcriptional repressor of bet genes
MPKIGQEPLRRKALVAATVDVIGEAGSLDVTVGQIAKRAGMSSALAHHYFGGKAQIFLAAMRHILAEYSEEVRLALIAAPAGQRLEALIDANFVGSCFTPSSISAWLNFYVLAQRDEDAARLLKIYQRRLHSNLKHSLKDRCEDPQEIASILAAQIDGVYLRAALSGKGMQGAAEKVRHVARALLEEKA